MQRRTHIGLNRNDPSTAENEARKSNPIATSSQSQSAPAWGGRATGARRPERKLLCFGNSAEPK
jgi:hypothetical protein